MKVRLRRAVNNLVVELLLPNLPPCLWRNMVHMSVSRRYSCRMWVILRHCLVTFQFQGSTWKDHQPRVGLLIRLLVWRQNLRLPSNQTSVWSRSAEGCLWRSRRPRCAAGSTPTGCEAEPCTAGRLRWPRTINTDGHTQTHIDNS